MCRQHRVVVGLANRLAKHLISLWDKVFGKGDAPKHFLRDAGDERSVMPDTMDTFSNIPTRTKEQAARELLVELEGAKVPKQIRLELVNAQGERFMVSGRDKEGFRWTNRLLARAFAPLLADGLTNWKELLREMAQATPARASTLPSNINPNMPTVVIEVQDGQAYVAENRGNVNVRIVDRDLE